MAIAFSGGRASPRASTGALISPRTSRWITGEQARADVHRLRAASDAVVVGVGTVLADGKRRRISAQGYYYSGRLGVLDELRFHHRHVITALHELAIIRPAGAQILHATGLHVREVGGVVNDAHQIRLEETDAHGRPRHAMLGQRLAVHSARPIAKPANM